jgi:hypothetical protein
MKFSYMVKKAFFLLRHKTIVIKEPALERTKPLIPGWLDPGHMYCFDYAIKNLPEKLSILEIGTFAGLSTNSILYFLSKYGKTNTMFTTDWFLNDINPDEKICNVKSARTTRDYLKESFIRNVRFFNPDADIKSSDLGSDEFFEAWQSKTELPNLHGGTFIPGGQIGFAYIDGNHKYDYAKRDFENVDKILVKGGFILFDDSADYTNWGSKIVAQEAVKSGRYKIVRKNPHYFVEKI